MSPNAAASVAPEERVAFLFEGRSRRARALTTPEGVVLGVKIASRSERVGAFCLDMGCWLLMTVALFAAFLLALRFEVAGDVGATLVFFLAFLIRVFYFTHFELAWRGRTPGKWVLGLRVIDRSGGPLTAGAIVARNLVREVELFLPLGLFASLLVTNGVETWQQLSVLGWVLVLALLPFFNKDNLRAGDLIAGTLVIAMPKRALAPDLAEATQRQFSFSPDQLKAYGAFELQVLEELLRQKASRETAKLHAEVVAAISARIGWSHPVAPADHERFLRDFYLAERADLERAQLFGRGRADKTAANSARLRDDERRFDEKPG
jgi:uncharacterized RDD family membrane protein YckC